ncbi:hypothetical protein PRJ_3928 [Pseudomonas sp. XWY-1]|nr:hypothetical protein PRJ_3928 [Pseudomonas sp. XWY-1]
MGCGAGGRFTRSGAVIEASVGDAGLFAGKPAPTPDRWWTHIGG